MFCVIQEIHLKKENTSGPQAVLEVYSPFSIGGKPKYSYQYTGERFTRSIKTAYKISVHESYRENGKVRKRQHCVGTVDYYSIATDWFCLGDYDKRIEGIADALGVDPALVYDTINMKVEPLIDRVVAEYQSTAEYKTHAKHQKVIDRYNKAKSRFYKKYGIDADEYDYCYNVFGEVMNQAYIDQITAASEQRQQAYSSYDNQSHSTHNYSSGSTDYSGYLNHFTSTYTEDEKGFLKKFYKALSMKYHPDMNQGADTTKEMQLLNKLKDEWDV